MIQRSTQAADRAADRITPEFDLLVECCALAFPGVDSREFTRPGQAVDWAMLLAHARRHRVQGLVWHSLQGVADQIPGPVATALAGDAQRIATDGLRAVAESARLNDALNRAGVPVLFIKGLTLGKLAYGDPFLKMSWDIDILVPPEEMERAAEQLRILGYRLVLPDPGTGPGALRRWHHIRKESVWRSNQEQITVELHTRLADNSMLLPAMGVNSPRQIVKVAPGIELPTLASEELCAYLCVHGSSSAWFRLKWITDLAALLHDHPAARISQFYKRSKELGAGRSVDQALSIANKLYGTRLEPALAKRLDSDRSGRWLASAAHRQMLRLTDPTEVRFGTVMIHLTQFALQPGLAFKLNELARQVRDVATNRF